MLKKISFFISLVVFLIQINFAFAEIVPLKKPIQTKAEKEQKLLIDVLKPLPKPVTKNEIKEKKEKIVETKTVSKKKKVIDYILPKKKPLIAGSIKADTSAKKIKILQ